MEEEDDLNNETLDPSLLKKHNEMIQRLSARHQSRKPNPNSSSSSSSTFESTSSFLTKFTDSKQSIESKISQTRLSSSSSSDPKSNLTEISSQIESLEKLLAENSYFLPSYEVRSSLKSITDLKQTLDHLSSELIPKKKFSFKNKPISKKPDFIPISQYDVVSPPKVHVRDSPGFRNVKGETLVKDLSFGEFTLSDLDSCEVRLKGNVNALFVNKLRNCKVYTGPVIGSVLIDDVEDCVLVLASHQIRIHCAKRCDFYLGVRSRPIIEDSYCVRFAPYCLRYDGIEEDLNKAGLEEENESWCNVDDFLWLRALQSPNWSVLPQDESVSQVSIS